MARDPARVPGSRAIVEPVLEVPNSEIQLLKIDQGDGWDAGDTKSSFVAGLVLPWLLMDGSSKAIHDFPNLFAALGSVVGVDSDHFYLPNVIDRMLVGAGGLYPVKSSGGSATSSMPVHAHGGFAHGTVEENTTGHIHNMPFGEFGAAAGTNTVLKRLGGTTDKDTLTGGVGASAHDHDANLTIDPAGDSGTNLPPYVAVYHYIHI